LGADYPALPFGGVQFLEIRCVDGAEILGRRRSLHHQRGCEAEHERRKQDCSRHAGSPNESEIYRVRLNRLIEIRARRFLATRLPAIIGNCQIVILICAEATFALMADSAQNWWAVLAPMPESQPEASQ